MLFFFMNDVAFAGKNTFGFGYAFRCIKFNAKYAVFLFSVVYNSYVFDTDIVESQNRSNGSEGTGFIRDFNIDGVNLFDGAAGCFDKGISVCSCIGKEVKYRGFLAVLDF